MAIAVRLIVYLIAWPIFGLVIAQFFIKWLKVADWDQTGIGLLTCGGFAFSLSICYGLVNLILHGSLGAPVEKK